MAGFAALLLLLLLPLDHPPSEHQSSMAQTKALDNKKISDTDAQEEGIHRQKEGDDV